MTDKVTQNNPGKTNRTDGAFPLFTGGKAGMIVGFGPLSATLDKDKKVDYGIAPMPTNGGMAPQTYGVTDYLNAFKKPGNQQAVKDFYELYYQPDQVNTFIKAEGFLPVTKSGLDAFKSDAGAEGLPRHAAQHPPDPEPGSDLGQGAARRAAADRRRGGSQR